MSKITLEMKSDRINSIISDYCTQDDLKDIEKDSQEEMVDIRVFNLMETMYPDNIIVAQNKKNEPVYKLLKSKQHDGKRGRSDMKAATGIPAAASFKHVSPAGAAIGLPLSDTLKKIYFVDDVKIELSPLACAYARARGADRMCSYGDFVALSDVCDAATATLIKREVSDGVIAPGYTDEALEILKDKRKGTYNVIKIDPNYVPQPIEHKQVFGITFEQGRNEIKLDDPALFENIPTLNKTFTDEAKRDLIIALITLKYTQSNSVCYVKDGQAIGIGAGQQSRIHCTRLAGQKADTWWLRQCPKVMNLPFKPGIRRADRDNTIDVYISEEHEDVLRDGTWEMFFTEKPEVLTMEEKKAWIAQNTKVALGSDAFFPARRHRNGRHHAFAHRLDCRPLARHRHDALARHLPPRARDAARSQDPQDRRGPREPGDRHHGDSDCQSSVPPLRALRHAPDCLADNRADRFYRDGQRGQPGPVLELPVHGPPERRNLPAAEFRHLCAGHHHQSERHALDGALDGCGPHCRLPRRRRQPAVLRPRHQRPLSRPVLAAPSLRCAFDTGEKFTQAFAISLFFG